MPFRDPRKQVRERFDPLARLFELEAAFETRRGFAGDRVPLRLAAVNLILAPGDAEDIAAGVNEFSERIDARAKWNSVIGGSMGMLLSAVLYEHGDTPEAFIAEVEGVRPRLRELGMRRSETYEMLAVLLLRLHNELGPVSDAQLDNLVAVHAAMKRHHRWLTGPEDYPACAFFSTQPGTPEFHAGRAHAVYQALRKHASVWRGDPLQTASNMLALCPLEPDELARRFAALALALRERKLKVRTSDYDEAALLCFLAQPIELIVSTVLDYREQLRERLSHVTGPHAFTLAANLTYVRLLGADEQLGKLADLKALLDMQMIIAARAAAAAAAGAA